MFKLSIESSHKVSSISIQFGEEDEVTISSSEPKPIEKKEKERREFSSRSPSKPTKPTLGGGFDMSKVEEVSSVSQPVEKVSIPDVGKREPVIENSMKDIEL